MQHQKLEKLYISTRAGKVAYFLSGVKSNLNFILTPYSILNSCFSIIKGILFVVWRDILSPDPNRLKLVSLQNFCHSSS